MSYNYSLDGKQIWFLCSNDKNTSHLLAALTREILSLLLERKIHTLSWRATFFIHYQQ